MRKLLVALLCPLLANAEPGPIAQYLVNQPASLMDVGMMRLETLATEFENRVGLHWTEEGEATFFSAEVNAYYLPEDDIIYVSFLAMNSEPDDSQMLEGCTNAMFQMNIWLNKRMHRLFSHVGYEDPERPPDFYRQLSEMFEIRCYFSSGRDTSEGRFRAWRRLGPLGSRDITVDRSMTDGQ